MINIEMLSLILAGLTAVASGIVGSFALMRRMTLAGDALSHVALPGIGLALIYSYNPVLGGGLVLLFGTLIIWKVEKISKLNTEAVIGVLFAASLAVGALAFEEAHELVEVLFGGIATVTANEFIYGSIIAAAVIWFILKNRHSLVLALVSKELARTAGISTDRLQLYFLLSFALTVILGMKFLGVLLMGSLIIIPASAARNIARNLNSMLVISSGISLFSVLSGIAVSNLFSFQLGPAIIIIASAIFLITLIWNALSRSS